MLGKVSVLFGHVKLKSVASGKNFATFCALEGGDWCALVEMNFTLVEDHISVSKISKKI